MKTRYKYKKLSFLSVTEFEGMRCLGTDDYCCTESDPCKEGEGDCDSDSDCEGSLVCGSYNCNSSWHGSMDFDSSDDCCKAQDQWSSWDDASDCQLIDNVWKKHQNRTCLSETCSGLPESKWQLIECDSVDGGWSSWSDFGDCEQTELPDNQLWYKKRTRSCDNPEPKFGGFSCYGSSDDSSLCDPIDGEWSSWSDFGDCEQTELPDNQLWYKKRSRTCDNPEPKFGGSTCYGSSDDSSMCEPIDGTWTEWIISEGDCNLDSNGEWTKPKSRTCNEPRFGGLDCQTDIETGEAEIGSYVCPPGDDFVLHIVFFLKLLFIL